MFVPYLPRIVARVRGTWPSRDRLTFGEDDQAVSPMGEWDL